MAKEPTEKQQKILDFIIQEIEIKGYPPTIREIGQALGMKSLRGVTDHLDALEKKGHIRRGMKARSIKVLPLKAGGETVSLPLMGRIAAGQPILAEENVEEYLPVEKELLRGSTDVFLLRVHGDSMIQDQIRDGDIVAVRSQQTASNGDIVVALLESEATVKRFFMLGNRPVLVPANPRYSVIDKPFVIQGKVIAILPKKEPDHEED